MAYFVDIIWSLGVNKKKSLKEIIKGEFIANRMARSIISYFCNWFVIIYECKFVTNTYDTSRHSICNKIIRPNKPFQMKGKLNSNTYQCNAKLNFAVQCNDICYLAPMVCFVFVYILCLCVDSDAVPSFWSKKGWIKIFHLICLGWIECFHLNCLLLEYGKILCTILTKIYLMCCDILYYEV